MNERTLRLGALARISPLSFPALPSRHLFLSKVLTLLTAQHTLDIPVTETPILLPVISLRSLGKLMCLCPECVAAIIEAAGIGMSAMGKVVVTGMFRMYKR